MKITSRKTQLTPFLSPYTTATSTSSTTTQHIIRIQSSLPNRMIKETSPNQNPQNFVVAALKERGITVEVRPSIEMAEGFFFEPTVEETKSYRQDVIDAVRSQDIETLRKFLTEGRPLKCSNRFGESLLHMACRRGFLDVVKFFIEEANVPVRVKDDYGRTPLHDACWTTVPNFELMELLVKECPDLLFLADVRGYTPLTYARRDHWAQWNEFLQANLLDLVPQNLRQGKSTVANDTTSPVER
mmetsp:Transcript_14112/g.22044  ORF Transcript_14112/g.22044 Transcript_14112/m.22044 type:complete len:243 (+) Transcript_14112:104-832(+)|eukprot:CAMPEP_0195292106 /NCGR_PEP_ID=MMETSP0707-20130614/8620_1 /TAXON_ID=33640 /ORGANISM="Asterionellopsis glacialis, Strain CCMP134" /LENGTH=242 /DNA_ID=CAMNT_0040352499 /DNA_START=56 /DNA_END=784 /DNA_ORIENTATION=+